MILADLPRKLVCYAQPIWTQGTAPYGVQDEDGKDTRRQHRIVRVGENCKKTFVESSKLKKVIILLIMKDDSVFFAFLSTQYE